MRAEVTKCSMWRTSRTSDDERGDSFSLLNIRGLSVFDNMPPALVTPSSACADAGHVGPDDDEPPAENAETADDADDAEDAETAEPADDAEDAETAETAEPVEPVDDADADAESQVGDEGLANTDPTNVDLADSDPAAEGGSFVVVTDKGGFVGAYRSVASAETHLRRYHGIPLVYGSWPCKCQNFRDVWVLPYKGNKTIACASDDRSVVEAAQKALYRLELVPPDDLKYWAGIIDETSPPGKKRLESILQAIDMAARSELDSAEDGSGEADSAEAKFMSFTSSEGRSRPDESARVNILQNVIPCALFRDGR